MSDALLHVGSGKVRELYALDDDRLHQRSREPAMPGSLALVRALRADGVPAVVSGAGPTVLAFTDSTEQAALAGRAPAGWQPLTVPIDRHGARVELRDPVE